MDPLPEFLDDLKRQGQAQGHFLGLLHLLIGRRIVRSDGTLVSAGLTWRELAAWLKKKRWDPSSVTELGLNPEELAPRDRERFWYMAITRARVDSAEAVQAGERLAELLRQRGYTVT